MIPYFFFGSLRLALNNSINLFMFLLLSMISEFIYFKGPLLGKGNTYFFSSSSAGLISEAFTYG